MIRVCMIGAPLVTVDGRELLLGRADLGVLAALVYLVDVADTAEVRELAAARPASPRALQSSIFRLRQALGEQAVITARNRVGLNRALVSSDIDDLLRHSQSLAAGDALDAAARTQLTEWADDEPFSLMRAHPGWSSIRQVWTDRLDSCQAWLAERLADEGVVGGAVAQARLLVDRSPQAARHWGLLANLLAVSGRRVEALNTIDSARREMVRHGLSLDADLQALRARLTADAEVGRQPQPVAAPVRRSLAPTGRDVEFERVIAVLDGIEPVSVVLKGVPGIGKSLLARALVRRAQVSGQRTATVFGIEGRPMSATDVLRSLLAQLDPSVAQDGDAFYLLGALATSITAADTRTVLFVDDAQWLDQDALVWLALVAAQTATLTRLLVTARSNGAVVPTLQRSLTIETIRMNVLERGAIGELLAQAGLDAPETLVDEIAVSSGGLPLLVSVYIDARRRSVGAELSLRSVVQQRLAGLSDGVRTLVQAAALNPRGVPEEALPALLAGTGGQLVVVADALDSQLLVRGAGRLAIAHELVRTTVLELMDALTRSRLAAALVGEVAGGQAGSGTMQDRFDRAAYLLMSDSPGRFDAAEIVLLRAVETVDMMDGTSREAAVAQALALMRQHGAQDGDVVGLLALRGIADYMQRPQEWSRSMRVAYQAALVSGRREKVVQLLRVMSRNRQFATATVEGDEFRSIAMELLRDTTLTPRDLATVQAVVAFHEASRYSPELARILINHSLVTASSLDDGDLEWWILRSMISVESTSREFEDLAERLVERATPRGDLAAAFEAKLYLVCARMRRREITFRDPVFDELRAMGSNGRSMYVRAQWMFTDWLRRRATGDEAGAARILAALRAVGGAMPLVVLVIELRERLASAAFLDLDPGPLLGDPTRWGSDVSIDLFLYQLSVASSAGDLEAVRRGLATITEPVIAGRNSAMSQVRLPQLTLLVHRLGDPKIAARLLELHLPMAGIDLCVLPGGYYGPTEHWLAALARVAGDARHVTLQQVADARWAEHLTAPPTR